MRQAFQIRVPGSTANLGPGFDSIGAALTLYLTLDVTLDDQWSFEHIGPNTPKDTTPENHLIYQIAHQIAEKFNVSLPSCKIIMRSELPLARGLGSSAAAIVAGIELANILADLKLSTRQKLSIASEIEGHPDNATASVIGGITISAMHDDETDTIVLRDADISLVVMIPNFELKTADARAVLPSQFQRGYAVEASANANMLVAYLLQKNFERVGYYMEKDLFHEPFRSQLIPHFYEMKDAAKSFGAYGTALSGAGPTMISFVPSAITSDFVKKMQHNFKDCIIMATNIDNNGVRVIEKVQSPLKLQKNDA